MFPTSTVPQGGRDHQVHGKAAAHLKPRIIKPPLLHGCTLQTITYLLLHLPSQIMPILTPFKNKPKIFFKKNKPQKKPSEI
jgi:hypothetical protein